MPKHFIAVTNNFLQEEAKHYAKKCSVHHTTSLFAHTAKTVARIPKRTERKIQDVLGEDQFSFRIGRGTRDEIGMIRIASE